MIRGNEFKFNAYFFGSIHDDSEKAGMAQNEKPQVRVHDNQSPKWGLLHERMSYEQESDTTIHR